MYYRYEEVASEKKDFTIYEARSGVEAPGKHIPGSCFLPFAEFQNKDARGFTTMKSPEEIKKIMAEKETGKKAVFSCGGGITACIDALAYSMVHPDEKFGLYDGSFSEYSARQASS